MSITVNLLSGTPGELKRFLSKYYAGEILLDDEVGHWIYTYFKSIESIDVISVVMDNIDEYDISTFIQINNGDFCRLTPDNYNEIIKDIFSLYYCNNSEYSDGPKEEEDAQNQWLVSNVNQH